MRTDGIEKWFSDCFNEYSDGIFRFCLVRVDSRDVALDVTQDTFARFWDYMREGRAITNPRALLFTIARNRIIDEYRRHTTDSLDAHTELETSHVEAPSQENEHMYQEALNAIKRLPEPFREVVFLRYVEEMKPKEIAAIIGEKENIISIRITRGMKILRESLV